MYSPAVSFPFAVFFVAVLTTKLLHLYIHAHAIPVGLWFLYLPTFFLPDLAFLCAARLLLRRERGLLSLVGYLAGCLLSVITLGAASSQLGFYSETGGELEWEDAGTFTHDAEGIKVLLSGGLSVVISGTVLMIVAWFSKNVLYKVAGEFFSRVGSHLGSVFLLVARRFGLKKPAPRDLETSVSSPSATDRAFTDGSASQDDLQEARSLVREKNNVSDGLAARFPFRFPAWLATTVILTFLGLTTIFRPQTPYTHMSTTLPIPLFGIFKAKPDYCAEQSRLKRNKWPLPELTDRSRWEAPKGGFKGWAPGTDNEFVTQYRDKTPTWLPDPAPTGFTRYDPMRFRNTFLAKVSSPTNNKSGVAEEECPDAVVEADFYNPVDDPLRISNLDTDILESLKKEFDMGNVKIKHVALILMESMREELFPIQQGSDYHRFILESHEEADRDEINSRISRMTPNSEKITGKSGNFNSSKGTVYERDIPQWNDTTRPGFGGINIVGGLTPSTASTKSVAASHCGVWPMPVDMFEESETQSYQPCIPQVLELFNQLKENGSSSDYLEHPWYPAFFQAVTDTYDRQHIFGEKMGLKYVVAKTRLENDTRDNPDIEDNEQINYFGFSEPALLPYLTDYITNATANNQRMFLSHFTSTTHHPWKTPKSFEDTQYLRTQGMGKSHEDFDHYLNTIHFHDTWLGQLMQLFEDLNISNETLVVFVGDHGQAFKEDHSKTGTYENGHISNFRVPISFRHPNLPRIQYEVNATSLSILPTILDLLINTGSLNNRDTEAASDLIHDYEGQSLIRPYKTMHNGRRAWNFGVVNSGGGMLTVTSADAPWRLVLPLDQEVEYIFTDLSKDPLELKPLTGWSVKPLVASVTREYGEDAAEWVAEADAVARWWALERKRLWHYRA
ncbi:hypothetical protein G7046_g5124 [Stylonectria norvegica]|nr:hypothetical protein G7046_g5124 [Stylonectria norvegica]